MHLYWKFSNEYIFNHTLTTIDEAYTFTYATGLTTHPSVIEVWVMNDDKKTTIFIRK